MRAVVALAMLAVAATGCVTKSRVPLDDADVRELEVRVGDELRVVTVQRDRISLEVSELREDRLLGVTLRPRAKETRPAGVAVEVPYADLAMLEVTRFDATAAALAGAYVLLSVTAFAAVVGAVPVLPPPGP